MPFLLNSSCAKYFFHYYVRKLARPNARNSWQLFAVVSLYVGVISADIDMAMKCAILYQHIHQALANTEHFSIPGLQVVKRPITALILRFMHM
jgi:hypothetical protein